MDRMTDHDDALHTETFLTDEELFGDVPTGAHRIDNQPDAELLGTFDDADVHAAAAAITPDIPPLVLPSRNGGRVLPNVRKAGLLDYYRSHTLTGTTIGNLPAPQPLVEGWLDRDSLAVLYGRPGAAKSFVALDIAACVTTGSWWHGRAVTKGKVLYVAAEGAYALGTRVAAWLQANNVYDQGVLDQLHWLVVAPNLFVADDAAALANLAYEIEPSLIIIDTLARTSGGADENSARDLGYIIANLDRIRDLTSASVLVVHHTNKAGESIRGHSALEGAVDTVIECKLDDGLVTLTSTKQKNHEAPAPRRLALSKVGKSCALTERSRDSIDVDNLPTNYRTMLTWIAESDLGDGLSRADIKRDSGVSSSSAYRQINRLTDLGLLTSSGKGARARFSITDLGQTVLGEPAHG